MAAGKSASRRPMLVSCYNNPGKKEWWLDQGSSSENGEKWIYFEWRTDGIC